MIKIPTFRYQYLGIVGPFETGFPNFLPTYPLYICTTAKDLLVDGIFFCSYCFLLVLYNNINMQNSSSDFLIF